MVLNAQSSFDNPLSPDEDSGGYLAGQFLIAGPGMNDDRFKNTVIYMCVHDQEQAMGIIINRPKDDLSLSEMLGNLDIHGDVTHEDNIVLYGGPVEQNRGFVLHSRDYFDPETSLPLSKSLALSTSKNILKSLVEDNAPKSAVLALGYAGWHAGQLETEIMQNGWFTAPADEALIFSTDHDNKWKQALAKLGITPELLSAEAGNA